MTSLTGRMAATRFSPHHIREERAWRTLDCSIGWGAPVRGREAKGLEVFSEALAYYARLQQEGVIEGFETAILEPHGGDLQGFVLVRGSEARLAQLRVDDEFVRLSTRASLIVEGVGVGVIGAALGDGLEEAIGTYQQAISELT